jgi:hypothetical protein
MKGIAMTAIHKPLPESLIKAIRATNESPWPTAQEKLEAVVLIAHGYGLFTKNDGAIDPTGYAIPEEQWGTINGMLMAVSGSDSVAMVNVALDWMNIGPSSYKAGA